MSDFFLRLPCGIYPHLVTDALVIILTQHEFQRQVSDGLVKLPYTLSNGAKFLLKKEEIESRVVKAIENLMLKGGFNPVFIAALNECVFNNNLQDFGTVVRLEFVDLMLFQEGKEEELRYLLDYLHNFEDKYFNASIQAIVEFLIRQQFIKEATQGERQIALNSICQSLANAAEVEKQAQAMVKIANRVESSRQNRKLRYEEIPAQRKIIEKRKFPGQLKVVASWYLIWNIIHQFAWDLIFAIVLCNILVICTNQNLSALRSSRQLVAICTSLVHINMRMNSKAKNRWESKYGNRSHEKTDLVTS